MKHRFVWASALALAVTVISQVETVAQVTNGVILISTRAAQDTAAGLEYVTQEDGPGMSTPGDAAMGALLAEYGYSSRIIADRLLGESAGGWCSQPPLSRDTWLVPLNANFAPALIIMSGSSGSTEVPWPTQTNGIPMMMGEHVCLGDRDDRQGSIHMYTGRDSSDPNQGNTTVRHMKVVNPNHPIMQGIPLDAQGRVKIWRDPYSEENAHVPVGARANYEFRWCTQAATNAAPGTTILGVLAGDTGFDGTNRACLAVCDVGGILATNLTLGYAETNQIRMVHMFVNEQGSGGSRRIFNALTDLGRIIFVRAAKWAMGETLQPFQGLGIIDVSMIGSQQLKLSWQGSAAKNYKILGTANLFGPDDFSNWQTIAQDILGTNGVVSRTLDISAGPQIAFLRVKQVP